MSDREQDRGVDPERRKLLKTVGLAGGAAALGMAGQAGAAKPAEGDHPPAKSGYRETEHIRAYYDSARI